MLNIALIAHDQPATVVHLCEAPLHLPTVAEYPCHRPEPATCSPCPASSGRLWLPLLGGNAAAIGEAFIPAKFLLSLRWAQKARHSWRSTPVASHCLNRRQQVLGLPYRRGSPLRWEPVHRIRRMPSTHRRSSTRGRPPRAEALGRGRCMRIASYGCVVSPRHAMSCLLHWLGFSWRDDAPTRRF
jgi:hypothetical protein